MKKSLITLVLFISVLLFGAATVHAASIQEAPVRDDSGYLGRVYSADYDKMFDNFERATLESVGDIGLWWAVTDDTATSLTDRNGYLHVNYGNGLGEELGNPVYKAACAANTEGVYPYLVFVMKGTSSLDDLVLAFRYDDNHDDIYVPFRDLIDPDMDALPALTNEYQVYIINILDSLDGLQYTREGESTIDAGAAMVGFHLLSKAGTSGTLDIREVYYSKDQNTLEYTETTENFLIDAFERENVHEPVGIYWCGSCGTIIGKHLMLTEGSKYRAAGYDASNAAGTYKNLVIRLRGEKGIEDITVSPMYVTGEGDVYGEPVSLKELLGPDSLAVPAISTGFQSVVINFEANGWDNKINGLALVADGTVYVDQIFFTNMEYDASEVCTDFPVLDAEDIILWDNFEREAVGATPAYDANNPVALENGMNFIIAYAGMDRMSIQEGNLVFDCTENDGYMQYTAASSLRINDGSYPYVVFKVKTSDGGNLGNFRIKTICADDVRSNDVWANGGLKSGTAFPVATELQEGYRYITADGYTYLVIDLAASNLGLAPEGFDIFYSGSGKLWIDEIFFAKAGEEKIDMEREIVFDNFERAELSVDDNHWWFDCGNASIVDGELKLDFSAGAAWYRTACKPGFQNADSRYRYLSISMHAEQGTDLGTFRFDDVDTTDSWLFANANQIILADGTALTVDAITTEKQAFIIDLVASNFNNIAAEGLSIRVGDWGNGIIYLDDIKFIGTLDVTAAIEAKLAKLATKLAAPQLTIAEDLLAIAPVEGAEAIQYTSLNFSNFADLFMQQVDGIYRFNDPTPVFQTNYGGGIIGYFLVASLNTIFTTHIGTICIVVVLFLLALLFHLYYPIKALVIYARSESKVKEFKSAKKRTAKEKPARKIKNEIVPEVVAEEKVIEEEPIDLDLSLEVSEIISQQIEHKQKPTDFTRLIPSHEIGFVKPTFGAFNKNNNEVHEEKVEEKMPETPVVEQSQPVYDSNEEIHEYNYEYEEIVEEPIEEIIEEKVETYVPQQETYSYPNNNIIEETYEESYDYENESFEEENNVEESYGYVNEQTLEKYNDFEKEEIITPEPPVERIQTTERITPAREVISELPDEQEPGSFDIVINPSSSARKYIAPSAEFLKDYSQDADVILENKKLNDERLNTINNIFEQLKIGAQATGYTVGPSVTRFDIFPNRDVSVNTIEKFIPDLSSRLGGVLARFEKIVQGKTSSALEVPNKNSVMVGYKEAYHDLPKKKPGADLYVPFGKNIDGTNIGANLAKFPHLLVSGSTGSGKSVYINSLIITLLLRNSPDELKMLIIDPKEVDFARYNGIPHLLGPVIASSGKAKIALDRLATEMDDRYSFLRSYDYTDIKDYNEEAEERGLPKLPYIVCIIDEYADLIENDKTISSPVTRITAKARACGIHLIIATQRPTATIITGTIKSNIPVRVAFMASSGVDSRVMLDVNGAESLVGNGDMLVACQYIMKNSLIRAQGYFISSNEIKNILNDLKSKYKPEYDPNFTNLTLIDEFGLQSSNNAPGYLDQNLVDPIYPEVREYVYGLQYCSISNLQRTFNLGFNRAAKITQQLIKDGIISAEDGIASKGKEVYIHSEAEYNDKVLDDEIK